MHLVTHLSDPEALKGPISLLTIDEVAKRLGCSRPHVYRLIAMGVLSVVDISTPGSKRSKSRVRSDVLEDYITSQTWSA